MKPEMTYRFPGDEPTPARISILLYVVGTLALLVGVVTLVGGLSDSSSLEVTTGLSSLLSSLAFFALGAIISWLKSIDEHISGVADILRERTGRVDDRTKDILWKSK